MKVLVIDVGGTHVKVLATGRRTPLKLDSGPELTPQKMVAEVLEATHDWSYDVVSIGYPGPVAQGRPSRDPWNLAAGWVEFDFDKALGHPVRVINDAAKQALGVDVVSQLTFHAQLPDASGLRQPRRRTIQLLRT